MNSNQPIPINTTITEAPQLQTVVQDGLAPITSIINAPWVQVTSVNGMTGDVTVQLVLDNFEPNHYYLQNTAILYNGSLYYARESFTSGTEFNINDWNYPKFTQVQTDWNVTDDSLASFIKNKPTKLSQFINDESYTTPTEVGGIVTENIAGIVEDVDGLKSSVNGINTSISDITSNISSITGDVSTLDGDVKSLETTVTNMKTDGSVTKLGTKTVGNTSRPIYLNSGQPAETTVTTSNYTQNAIVGINDARQTIVSHTITMQGGDGGVPNDTICTIKANDSGLFSTKNIYIGTPETISENNRLVKVSELSNIGGDGWNLINKYVATSSTTQTQIYASVPSGYRGYPWEYKVIVGFEVAPEGGDVLMTVDGTNGKYSSSLSGYRNGAVYNEETNRTADWMGMKWPCLFTNDACAAEILVTRAGSGNYWLFNGTGGGYSSAVPATITFGGRIEDSSDITYFNLNKTFSGGAWLAGSHIEIYARKYV